MNDSYRKNHSNNIQILAVIAKTIRSNFVKIKKVHRENKDHEFIFKDKEIIAVYFWSLEIIDYIIYERGRSIIYCFINLYSYKNGKK
jgi:hypothetical protein